MHYLRIVLQFIPILVTKIILKIFLRIQTKGIENISDIDYKKGVIFAANHKSQVDVFVLASAFPTNPRYLPLYFLALRSRHYSGIPWARYIYGGWLFELFGGVMITRGLKDYSKTLREHEILLRKGRTLCIFPEGKRVFEKDKIAEAHGGMAYLADMTNVPIVPVSIKGVHEMSAKAFFGFKRKAVVKFGKPRTYRDHLKTMPRFREDYANQVFVYKQVSEQVMSDISGMYFS